MFSKIDVNGDDAHPLWKWMKEQPKGRGTLGNAIKWNFTKFLINREGQVVKRYSPMEDPYVSAARMVGVWALPAPWHQGKRAPGTRVPGRAQGASGVFSGQRCSRCDAPSFLQVIEKDLPSYL
uniref:phospholipid-hydroperoxide glutathione peroxidase n=1 Tax=Anser brachyrhynchus TaxID=132585 RepID=A0A8B9BKK3_9AVES